ncbi:MAG: response regulator [Pirellula sp.]
MRIVIADKNVAAMRPFQSYLRSQGHHVELAGDGLEYLFSLREMVPDVMVIGIELEGVASEEVLTTMEQNSRLRNIPVLLMVSPESDTDLRRHSMVVSAARPKTRFDDLARQLSFLNILNEAGIRMKGARQMRLATIPVMRMESEIGTA